MGRDYSIQRPVLRRTEPFALPSLPLRYAGLQIANLKFEFAFGESAAPTRCMGAFAGHLSDRLRFCAKIVATGGADAQGRLRRIAD